MKFDPKWVSLRESMATLMFNNNETILQMSLLFKWWVSLPLCGGGEVLFVISFYTNPLKLFLVWNSNNNLYIIWQSFENSTDDNKRSDTCLSDIQMRRVLTKQKLKRNQFVLHFIGKQVFRLKHFCHYFGSNPEDRESGDKCYVQLADNRLVYRHKTSILKRNQWIYWWR